MRLDNFADTPSLSSGPDDTVLRLHAAVQKLPAPRFAVVDGAWFDDLSALLSAVELPHRSLFLVGASHDQQAGPWLVELDEAVDPNCIRRIVSIVGDLPALVFWSCPTGEAALHRHLRTINSVLIPQDGTNAFSSARGDAVEMRVLMRHWDPSVLVSILPLLDEEQAARMLGPSKGLALNDPEGSGVATILRPPGLSDAAAGSLRFTRDQIAALSDTRMERFHLNTIAYLRENCPIEAAKLDDQALARIVRNAEAHARRVGLADGEDLRRWAWLWVESGGRIAQGDEIRRFMQDPANGPTAKSRLDLIWRELTDRVDDVPSRRR